MSAAAHATPPQFFDERERFHPRVEAGFSISLLLSGRSVRATARDLSMAGLYLDGPLSLDRERVTVSIPLPGDREVTASCTVRRRQDDGLALEFEHLDWDDLLALARYLHPRLP